MPLVAWWRSSILWVCCTLGHICLPTLPIVCRLRTWIQAGELAALFRILTEVLAALRSLTQCSDTHLRLAVMTRAAQAGIVPLRGEVVSLVYNVVFYIHTRLPYERNTAKMQPETRVTTETN